MATRTQLETRIADDLARSDLSSQITAAVSDAIVHYETHRFQFNEAQNFSCTFSSSVDRVPLSSFSTYFTRIDRLRIRISTNSQDLTDLLARDYSSLMDGQDVKVVCRPLEYCIYADAINFDSLPDQNYTGVIDGVKRLSTTASNSFSGSDATAWFNAGKQLIRARAKAELYAHVILDDQAAAKMVAIAEDEYATLVRNLNGRNSGRVRPTQF